MLTGGQFALCPALNESPGHLFEGGAYLIKYGMVMQGFQQKTVTGPIMPLTAVYSVCMAF